MLILGIDSAGFGCAACVVRDGEVVALAHEQMERGQDQRLMPLVLDVMKKAGVEFDQLDRIAVTRGPGSFTGIRIGLAAARGIGLASGKPVIGIDRFAVYREQIKTINQNLLVVINARRKEFFCRFYPARDDAAEPMMVTPEEIAAFLERHSGTVLAGDVSLPGMTASEESEVVTATKLAGAAYPDDIEHLPRPLYIRPPDVTMKKQPISFRGATPGDITILSQIHIESFGAAGWNETQVKGSLDLPTTHGWIAMEGKEPVGFILCQIAPIEIEVLTFCVRPSHRKKGIGEKLLQQAIGVAQDTGASLLLEAAADNLPARKLYEKLGFAESGKRKNYYARDTGAVDAVLYTLAVNTRAFA